MAAPYDPNHKLPTKDSRYKFDNPSYKPRSTQQVESLTITILHFTFQKHVAVAKFTHQNRKQTYFE